MISKDKRREILAELIEQTKNFRFCGPSDDPDEQTAVTSGYRYLVIRFKRLASPILPSPSATRLNAIDVEIDNLYSAYDAKSEMDTLIPEIEAALDNLEDIPLHLNDGTIVIAESRLVELRSLTSSDLDFRKLVRMCEEINLAYRMECYYATAMLIRGLLDHVPPVFGYKTFSEVANNMDTGQPLPEPCRSSLRPRRHNPQTGGWRLCHLPTSQRV